MYHKLMIVLIPIFGLVFISCSGEESQPVNITFPNYDPNPDAPPPPPPSNPNDVKTKWDVTGGGGAIVTGCLGLDCIPSLQNPSFLTLEEANFLNEDDIIYGLVLKNEIRAYPMRILDWHEIVNELFVSPRIAITYCPLTGSGVGINIDDSGLNFQDTNLHSFGVSGFLYNNNLIPYDRTTFSNWSQMLLRCVNGIARGTPMVTAPLIETSWKTWKKMFPNSKVLSNNTGFDRPYHLFPYGNYKTDPFLLFPIQIDDSRLPRKERVHGIITDRFNLKAKTYRFTLFENGARAINDEVDGEPVVIAGMKAADLYISYSRRTADGTILTFDIKTESPHIYPFDLVDNEGNVWNLLGKAVAGARTGEQLTPTTSYNAYWFAWGTFFPGVPIYSE